MDTFELLRPLIRKTESKIILFVCDGLGGLPMNGRTELETARKRAMDELANRSELGQLVPVIPGISPGSGPGHLGLFGYDPVRYPIGRGVLSALGVQFDIRPGDLAVRLNFATLDAEGKVSDRRAGRLPTEENQRILKALRTMRLPGAELFLETEKEYRAVLVLRAQGLSDALSDSDPQQTGVPPLPVRALRPEAEKSARLLQAFAEQAREALRGESRANGVLLRGTAVYQTLPTFEEVYGLDAAAIATYPMYRGLGRLVGMTVYPVEGSLEEEARELERVWNRHTFFFLHFKYTDSTGEDGDFAAKVKRIEEADRALPRLLALKPDVLAITGDHSTPSLLKSHSWHPIPLLIHSPYVRSKKVSGFGETECAAGTLGTLQSKDLMPLLLAHAGKLGKFGA
ncbi:MAG: 2,3-bisphosphoglycerate-independent phosphoglycerate mutase [Planctomycetes bacterium]|nr:2,3-bisphosphoglycerate-independent phosphoglycerate mutase [Planctomycetota bacterium]